MNINKKMGNAFHAKLKLIPNNKSFKHWYMAGIVQAKSAKEAEEHVTKLVNEWVNKSPEFAKDGVQIRVMSMKKLKTDFIIKVPDASNPISN